MAGWNPLPISQDFVGDETDWNPLEEEKLPLPRAGGPFPKREATAPPTATIDFKQGVDIKPSSMVMILGEKDTGKTGFLREMAAALARSQVYNIFLLLNPNMGESMDTDDNDYSWLHPDFKCDDEEKFTERIEELISFQKADKAKASRACLILDDCGEYFIGKGAKTFENLARITTKLRITIIVAVHNMKKAPTTFRESCRPIYVTQAASKSYDIVSQITNISSKEIATICQDARVGEKNKWNVTVFWRSGQKPQHDIFTVPKPQVYYIAQDQLQ